MNKLKNIGISALVGSLVSLSAAQAGGVSVTGSWELSYTNLNKEKVSGNKLGMNKNLTFGAGGDLSDGGGVTWASTIVTSDTLGLTSASMNINMGGIATLTYDSGTGGTGANAVDNIVPTAWEEIDHGFSTGITDLGGISASKGVVNLTVKAPVAGTGISFSYAHKMGGDHLADGATSGDTGRGRGMDLVVDLIDYSSPHFGMRFGLAAETEIVERSCKDATREGSKANCGNTGYKDNPYGGSLYYTIKVGPLSLGTQATFESQELQASTAVMNKRAIIAGGALTFGDTFAVSYGTAWDRYKWNDANRGTASGVKSIPYGVINLENEYTFKGDDSGQYTTTRFHGYSASMNIGPVALKATRNKVSGMGENASSAPRTHSEINLSIAF